MSAVTFQNEYFLSKRQWLQQTLPSTIGDFGPTPSRRDVDHPPCQVGHWDVLNAVDDFVGEFDDSSRDVARLDMGLLIYRKASKAIALFNFQIVLNVLSNRLGYKLDVEANAQCRSSPGPNADAGENAVWLASSSLQEADYGVSVDGRRILVVEMKRPSVFRRSANSPIPNLCLAAYEASGPSPSIETVVLVEPIFQLYRYMKNMKLEYGILSSFELTFLVQRGGDNGDILSISEGISNTSSRFLGALAYIMDKAMKDPKDWRILDMKHAQGGSSHAFGPGSSQRQSSKGGSKGCEEEKRSPNQGLHGMRTWSYGGLDFVETPAELLHLARHHFAEGWSGRIVRGTYEGQHIVVKLAAIGSDRAKALLIEVVAYHKLKEFWGKYVPKLVSYGTTAGGKVVYIATEEIDGHEIGMGTLSPEVVKEIFDALSAMHGCGILHGDIRPSNILVVKGQQVGVRLIDFGFACLMTNNEDCMREHKLLQRLLNELTCSDVGVIH